MNLTKYFGCLSHLATADNMAVRDGDTSQDEDNLYYGVVSPYKLDIAKLYSSKALPRLDDKTQVFMIRINPYVRSRLRHSLEVTQLSVKIASVLGLNCDLAQAGAMGHDIGHLPFGHQGEYALGTILGRKVEHATLGVVVARKVERRRLGLNLTNQTLQVILHHSSGDGDVQRTNGIPEEAFAVLWGDKISYVFADINDFKRCIGNTEPELVRELFERADWFGTNQRQREATCFQALIAESADKGYVSFSESECAQQFNDFRKWLYKGAYYTVQGGRSTVIEGLKKSFELLDTCSEFKGCDLVLLLSLMTDSEARELISLAEDTRKLSLSQIKHFGIAEIYEPLKGFKMNLDDPWA